MFNEILAIVLTSAADSFIQVTSFVGAALIIFGFIDYKLQGRFVEGIENAKNFQPILGALLGLLPGCGGSIFIMPLYIKGTVSFGTVIATLIATAGDSAFLTITKVPKVFLIVSIISFVVAVITGYIVDHLKLGKRLQHSIKHFKKNEIENIHREFIDEESSHLHHIGHQEGDEIDLLLHHKEHHHKALGEMILHRFAWIFWIFASVGLIFGIIDLMQIENRYAFTVGIAGTIVSVAVFVISKRFFRDDTHEESEHKLMSMKETFIHNAVDTAFVGFWVFVAYLIYEITVMFIGGDAVMEGWMIASGITSVFIAALIGLIPGCGPQVLFVSLYLKGIFPFAALIANAISQDGDALFPLLALDRKSALYATIITTIPAIVVGLVVYFITN